MLLKGILATAFMLIALVVSIGVIAPVNEQVEAARTQNKTATSLACTTGFLFTVNYLELASGVDQNTSNIMQYIPLLLVLGAVFIAMLWLLTALKVIK